MAKAAGAGRQGKSTNVFTTLLALLLLGTIVLALLTFIHVSQREAYDEQYLLRTAETRILSQRIAKFALAAATGDQDAFPLLQHARDQFGNILDELKNGSPPDSLPPSPGEVIGELHGLEETWAELKQRADLVLANQEGILTVGEYIKVITELLPQLQVYADDVVKELVASGAPSEQVRIASGQLMLAQRIENNVAKVLAGGEATTRAIDQFGQDAERFGQVMEGMIRGDADLGIAKVGSLVAEQKLREVAMLFTTVAQHAEEIIDITPSVLPAVDAAKEMTEQSDLVNDAAYELSLAYRASPGRLGIAGVKASPLVITALGGLATLFLILLGVQLLLDARRREATIKTQNDANQGAILRLLDEMGELADGDLTVQATVTEDITGAIADSMNYAIEATRNLVTTIKSAAEQVARSAQDTRATQTDRITDASDGIERMTHAIDQMSHDATESAEVAQRSVEIATKGAGTVRMTIQGMDSIREQIQETSKRIKRLGESSQEIGDIVELIDDIADQTNILALNAAMQAAMAGEAGRGFAVVADEVQRLAERSSNATKQIDALVKTIQADTNEAVRSMEASTAGVVSGAKLAEDAGEALKEIENVSNYIADLTRKIAESAQQQSGAATAVNQTMTEIRHITTQTMDGSTQTAASIGNLADLANDLQKSVAGFRLPA